jgi:hypothetical protein
MISPPILEKVKLPQSEADQAQSEPKKSQDQGPMMEKLKLLEKEYSQPKLDH